MGRDSKRPGYVDPGLLVLEASEALKLPREQVETLVESLPSFRKEQIDRWLGRVTDKGRPQRKLHERALEKLPRLLESCPELLSPSSDESRSWCHRFEEESIPIVAPIVAGPKGRPPLSDPSSPFEYVPVPRPDGSVPSWSPDRRVLLYTVHDGNVIPESLGLEFGGENEDLLESFREDRDWGADLLAYSIAYALHLPGFFRVRVARNIVDFGRLPVVTQQRNTLSHLGRGAIHSPVSDRMNRDQFRQVLGIYDAISDSLERAIAFAMSGNESCMDHEFELDPAQLFGRSVIDSGLMLVGVHTYDESDRTSVQRPAASLIYRSESLATRGFLTPDLFDPLYPSELAEFTADRALVRRLGLVLERNYIPTAENYPYLLPDGGVELRFQAWAFFRYLQGRYVRDCKIKPDQQLEEMWEAIRNANSRSLRTIRTMAMLHRFARVEDPVELRASERLSNAYGKIVHWLKSDPSILKEYRFAPGRPSSLAVEVRKDRIARMQPDPRGGDIEFRLGRNSKGGRADRGAEIQRIGGTIAHGIREYLVKDRPTKQAVWESRRDDLVRGGL